MEQVEVTKTDVERKVNRVLKLIKRESGKKEPELVGLVEDFHRHYQSLYAQYEHLKLESSDKALKGKGDGSYPYYSSDSESEYYSAADVEIETDTAFDNNRSSPRWVYNNIKEELKWAYGEDTDLRHEFASRTKEKEDLASDHMAASSRTQETETFSKDEVTSLKTELEPLQHERRDLEVQIDAKTAENKQRGEKNKAMYVQIPDEGDEVSKLMKQIKDNENNLKSRISESMVQVCNLKKEVDLLRAQQFDARGSVTCESSESFDMTNVMKPEHGSLHGQKTKLEILLERKSKEISRYRIQVKSLKEEIARKSAFELTMVEENRRLQVQVMHLESEVDALRKQKTKSVDEFRSYIHEINRLSQENNHLNSRILELEALFKERGLELRRVKETARMYPMDMDKNAELQISDQQRTMKEIEENIYNSKLFKQLSKGNKPNYHILERKMEDLAQEYYQKVDDNITLLSLRIAVAEKIHYDNKESYNNIKERLEQENEALKQKLATCETELNKLKDDAAARSKFMVNKLQIHENPATRILKAMGELVSTKKNRKDKLKGNVDLFVAEMDKENNLVSNSEARLYEEEEQKPKLLKAVSMLENRVVELEKIIKEKDEALVSRAEEKRESIRQLCLLIEYHRSRCDHLKELVSKLILESQINNQQIMIEEQGEAYKKLTEECQHVECLYQDCKENLEVAERKIREMSEEIESESQMAADLKRMVTEMKMQEMAGEHDKSVQCKDQALADLEQIIEDLKRDLEMKVDELCTFTENVRTIEVKLRLKAEAKFLEEQRMLEERITALSDIIAANKEAYHRMITDISENVNNTLTGFEAFIQKFEQGYIESTSTLKVQKEQGSMLRERVEKLQIKANKEEEDKDNLLKTAKQLENKVEFLEGAMKEKDQGILGLGEEKREAIRQLCIWIDYHCSRCDDLKEILLKTVECKGQRRKSLLFCLSPMTKILETFSKSNTLSSSTIAETVLDVRLTKSQFETLHKILGTSTAHGSLAIQGTALNITSESNNQTSWILDSGASDHMTVLISSTPEDCSILEVYFASPLLDLSIATPRSVKEALKSTEWRRVVMEEMSALKNNGTWEISDLPEGKKTVGCNWIFTIQFKPNGSIDRHKARLVVKGFTQTYGLGYDETLAPIDKLNTIHVLISLVVNLDWPLTQLDVKNAFINGDYLSEVRRLKEFFSTEFELKDLVNLKYFLGMEVARSRIGFLVVRVSTCPTRFFRRCLVLYGGDFCGNSVCLGISPWGSSTVADVCMDCFGSSWVYNWGSFLGSSSSGLMVDWSTSCGGVSSGNVVTSLYVGKMESGKAWRSLAN
ncbi:LOW QUALITY PROTEIN: COP1-interactive protein 1-like [Hibiscus syriacus]|uniref:LOW QUALITY PROTEIN: COP1-interactive protein 1-like n=1 Tax=Hibiscus syriacus TaxID=106335 RepID=UPI001923E830|nr:LOW QUALITY PROTEIN: COP1-interactive protein 1-like [Hibiscus syriacus]